ncbi:MAG: hypothetical protein C0412_11545, partial [Flavobacterium sp.]|nr:hypothetical protein [Flavobacterium sp.]
MFKDILLSIKLAFKNIRTNKGRTILTLFGIVIGITSVIVIMASGQGVKGYVLGQIQGFGTDIIQVETKVPNTGETSVANAQGQAMGIQITTLKSKDADDLAKIPNVALVNPGSMGQETMSFRGANKRTVLYGNSANGMAMDTQMKLAEGVFYSEEDDRSLAQVIVLGAAIKDSLFGNDSALGKSVKMKGQNYKVIGVLEKRGMVAGFNYDELAYVP